MKKQYQMATRLLALSVLGGSAPSFAQIQSTINAVTDIHPYQSQITYRSNEKGINNGAVEVIPAVTVGEYTYYPDGPVAKKALNTGLMYDKRNPLPATEIAGLNYSLYSDGSHHYLSTVRADGTFIYDGMVDFKIASHGGVWFTESGTNNLYMVDSYGYYWNSYTAAPAIRLAGGNYFIDSAGKLTTFKSMGAAEGNAFGMRQDKSENFAEAKTAGGNFFVMNDNSVVTISSVNGFYTTYTTTSALNPDSIYAVPKIIGGNYYVGVDNILYTVNAKGELSKNPDFTVTLPVALKGYSFLKFDDGSFMFVDGTGFVHRSLLRISTNGTKVQELNTLPDSIDPSSLYLPTK